MTYPVIRRSHLSTPDGRRSRAVSNDEFQSLAAKGQSQVEQMTKESSPPEGLDRNWNLVVDHAHKASQEEWGGTTIDSHYGAPRAQGSDEYAITVRDPDHPGISVKPGASREHFADAMGRAREEYGHILSRPGHNLGVFHDADKGTVDIDPVLTVKNRADVESIGAYTRAVGGAYHFKSGDGYWPPHVKD